MQPRSVKVLSTGKYLPKRKVTVGELAQQLNLSADWIKRKSGVLTRYFIEDETVSFMGARAAQQALSVAELSPQDIDCIVCASSISEQGIPCTAVLIQQQLRLGDSGIPAFDVDATCLSFLAALDMLSYLVHAGRYRRVLLVSSEIASIGIKWSHPESATLFGDGAAAVIIEQTPKTESSSIRHSDLKTYGRGAELSRCLGGGNKHHPREFAAYPERFVFDMNGPGIYRMAAKLLPNFVQQLFTPLDLTMDNMDLVIPHQASLMAMRLLSKQLKIPTEKLMSIAPTHGNTMAASIPMALHEAIHQGQLCRGDTALLLGTGAGLSLGGIVLEY